LPGGNPAQASSHREAPFIATMPQVDGTDFYMFNSYEAGRSGYVTIVANYLPIQATYGGPNFFHLDPNALYEIHIVNDGGAVESITFQFQFQNTLDDNQLTVGGKNVSIPLVQNGSADVATPGSAALNVHESYTINVIYGPEASGAPQPIMAPVYWKQPSKHGRRERRPVRGAAACHVKTELPSVHLLCRAGRSPGLPRHASRGWSRVGTPGCRGFLVFFLRRIGGLVKPCA